MKIIFTRLMVKNFLSTGNAGLEYNLNENPLTLISAVNGSGKSGPLTDGLCFGLYGKPFRNINKPQLINTINNKDCVVEIEFICNSVAYKVVRGLKPAIFEIYCNGELLNQEADIRDYQEVLTKQILRMSYHTFTQVVILGSSNYVPFMKLSTAQRRDVIEELLDIRVFSMMAQLVKDSQAASKTKVDVTTRKIDTYTSKIEAEEKAIIKQQSWHSSTVDQYDAQVAALEVECGATSTQIQAVTSQIEEIAEATDSSTHVSKLTKLKIYRDKIMSNVQKHSTKREFFEQNMVCPTCSQDIESHHRDKFISEIDGQVEEFNTAVDSLNATMEEVQQKIDAAQALNRKMTQLTRTLNELNVTLNAKQRNISSIELQKQKAAAEFTINIDSLRELIEFGKVVYDEKRTRKDVLEKKAVIDAAAFLLKDGGIKTIVIRQYLPILNKLINKYLQALDLFVLFDLDEQFNEKIKSRHRDTFSYSSFSEGEKSRIDFSLLLSWRELARAKASVQTNLLILDEILDGSVDSDGISGLMNIFYSFTDTNLFIISHRQEWEDKFPNTVKLEKRNGFTVRVNG